MNNRRTWIERLYGCALYLYPRTFRDTWAEPMRQALRDRLREAGPAPGLALFIRELVPDLLASVGREHWIAYEGEAAMRKLLLVSLLLGSLMLLSSRDALSLRVQDWQQNVHAQRVAARDASIEASRAALLQALPTSSDGDLRTLAWPLSDWRMTIATTSPRKAAMRPALETDNRLAVLLAAGSCDTAALSLLQTLEADNGATWAISTTCALRSADDAGLQHALHQLTRATRYDSASGRMLAAATTAGELRQAITLREQLELDASGFVSSAVWGMHRAETEGVSQACVRGMPRAAGLTQPSPDMCRLALAILATSADSVWTRRIARSGADRLAGIASNEADRLGFRRSWDAALAAWLRRPAAERNAAATAADERALLARN